MLKRSWRNYPLILCLVLGILAFSSHRLAVVYTDWLWHVSLGTQIVFLNIYGARVFLFLSFGTASFFFAYFNVWLADRISPPASVPASGEIQLYPARGGRPAGRTLQFLFQFRRILDVLLLVGASLFAVGAGLSAQAQWDNFLRFTHPETFNILDPQFHRNIGFYVFRLPFLQYVQGWLLTITVLVGAGTAVVYTYQQGINRASGNMVMLPQVRGHLSVLVGIALLICATGHTLEQYALLTNEGRLPGADYTEVHLRLPYLQWLTGVACLAAIVSFANIWRRTIALPIVATLVWLGFVGIGLIWSPLHYHLQVVPSESLLEAPYLTRALDATHAAYNLSALTTKQWDTSKTAVGKQKPVVEQAAREILEQNALWDTGLLQESFVAQQGYRRFYTFPTVATDRAIIAGKQQTIQIAAREFTSLGIDPRAYTWPNLHLHYTHGYGAVVASGSNADGSPHLLLSGQPPVSIVPELNLTEPRLYFGSSFDLNDYAIVNSRLPEWDFGGMDGDHETKYTEKGGTFLTPLNRFAFALRFGAVSLLLSREVDSHSRLLFERRVSARVKRAAPFLLLDTAPYPVIVKGRIVWLQDAFTIADTYPYATHSNAADWLGPAVRFNYIRPSVTATVDAYDGTVHLYANDPQEPLLRSYQRIFPGLFLPLSALPSELQAHRRYPQQLFIAQQRVLNEYHVRDAVLFYSRADIWRVPTSERIMRADSTEKIRQTMPPIFAVVKLPEGAKPEFVCLSVFTPQGKTNVAAMLVARCDPPHFGELLLYKFDDTQVTPGPEQIARRIRENRSATLSTGTNDTLVGMTQPIPIGNQLFYLTALYTRSLGNVDTIDRPQPRLREVALAIDGELTFADTLNDALSTLAPALPLSSSLSPKAGSGFSAQDTLLIEQATTLYEEAQAALRRGDFAVYGVKNTALGDTLQKLHRHIPTDSNATPRKLPIRKSGNAK